MVLSSKGIVKEVTNNMEYSVVEVDRHFENKGGTLSNVIFLVEDDDQSGFKVEFVLHDDALLIDVQQEIAGKAQISQLKVSKGR